MIANIAHCVEIDTGIDSDRVHFTSGLSSSQCIQRSKEQCRDLSVSKVPFNIQEGYNVCTRMIKTDDTHCYLSIPSLALTPSVVK